MNPTVIERLKRFPNGVCHRGFHDLERPENSRAAFANAIEHGYPFEYDIHLTKDGRILVCHDSDLNRVCGKPGIIEELTLEEIQRDYTLSDSSTLASLEELLELNPGKVPMVIELKAYKGNGVALAKAAAPILKTIKNIDDCVVISFSAEALRETKAQDVPMPLGLLIGTEAVKHLPEKDLYEFDFLDVEVHYSLLPRFGRYRRKGGVLLCWTVRNRFTHFIGTHRCHNITWEILHSEKKKPKISRFMVKRYC